MSNDANIGISIIMKVVDQGTAIISQMGSALDKLGLSAQQAGQKSGEAGSQIEIAFKKAGGEAEKAEHSVKKMADSLASVGASLTAFGAGLLAPLGLMTKTAADFENQMNKVRAVANFSPDTKVAQAEFQSLVDKARELGNSTAFSATQVGSGLEQFARAGYDAGQSIAAIGPALNLAFAESRDLGATTEGLVSIMSALGLQADQTTRVTDVLAKTADSTTASMGSLTEAMS